MTSKKTKVLILCMSLILFACNNQANTKTEAVVDEVSKIAMVLETVGDATIQVEYDRLLTKGQNDTVFGSRIPYGEIWSPGDKMPTILDISSSIKINEIEIAAGTYNLFLIPEEISAEYKPRTHKDWEVILTKNENSQSKVYDSSKEVLRFKTRAQLEDNSKEQMEFFFEEREEGKVLRFLFEYVEVHFPIKEAKYTSGEIPAAAVMNSIGNSQVKINYHRANADNQKIYGNIVPFNQEWIAGGIEQTTIFFTNDVLINDQLISKGIYDFVLTPKEGAQWNLKLVDAGAENEIEFDEEIEVEISDSGPSRLEYFFNYISAKESDLIFIWDVASLSINIKSVNQ